MQKSKYLLYITLMLMLMLIGASTVNVSAAPSVAAQNVTSSAKFTLSNKQSAGSLTDDDEKTFLELKGDVKLTINSQKDFSGIYIKWNKLPGKWKLRINNGDITCGENGFLHEFIKLDSSVKNVTMTMPKKGAQICDIYLFSEGDLPEWVQVWQKPYRKADMLVVPTHSDDEQLFFAGVLPYYAGELGLKVQVIYMTNHWRRNDRPHELLNGLWTVGVQAYPVISSFPDDYRSYGKSGETGEEVLKNALKIYGENEVTQFQVEMIRRFRPKVIVGHDINGEYGHGAHRVNAYTIQKAVEISADSQKYPESAAAYGTWDVPKTYLHLWYKNRIVMDWDKPLKKFGGKTAFEMSKQGYACHLSQQESRYTKWVSENKAGDIKKYSPCEYGLYRTTAGKDILKNDFFENLVPYDDPVEYLKPKHVPALPSTSPSPVPSPSRTPSLSPTPSPPPALSPKFSTAPSPTSTPAETEWITVSSDTSGKSSDPETYTSSAVIIPVLLGSAGVLIAGGSIASVVYFYKKKH